MTQYVCLLRSVNVSGVNRIKMDMLKVFFESLDFQEVITYIQSGNIIFNAEKTPSATDIEIQLQKEFHTKNVAVILKTPEEMANVITQNPFRDRPKFDPKKLYVHYLENIPDANAIHTLSTHTFEDEFFIIQKDIIYVYYVNSRGNAKLSNSFFEKKLQLRSTARNWNTTNKLYTLTTMSHG